MILQAFDFYQLFKKQNCILQIGGSDQWGNIVNGTDLIRRILKKEAYGLTSLLLLYPQARKWKLKKELYGLMKINLLLMIIGSFGEIQTIVM